MNRRILNLLACAGAIFALCVSGARIAAADEYSGRTLVGSWVVRVTAPDTPAPFFVDLTTVNKDRTMLNTNALLGTGHGAWERTGDSTFAIKFMTLIPPVNPFGAPLGATLVVAGSLAVDQGGQTASGAYKAAVILPPAPPAFEPPPPLFEFEGTIDFSRILVDMPDG